MFFCDKEPDKANALAKRLESLNISRDKFFVYPSDCNLAIDVIIPQVKHGHSLIFIDPYGMQISWILWKKYWD